MTNSDLILLLVQMLIEERDNNKELTAKLNDKRENTKWFLHNDTKKESTHNTFLFCICLTIYISFFMTNSELTKI